MNKKIILLEKKVIILSIVIGSLIFFNFILMGSILNQTALISNGLRMPVQMEEHISTSTHFSFTNPQSVNNYYLTDIYSIGKNIYSIGDILMIFFFSVMVISVIYLIILVWKYLNYKKRYNDKNKRRKYN